MKNYSRRRETIKSGIYILIGILGLYFITIKFQESDIETHSVMAGQVEDAQTGVMSEQEEILQLDAIYEWGQKPINEENISQLLKTYLPGGHYLNHVGLQQNKDHYSVTITYIVQEYSHTFSTSKKGQIALIDASILMSLFPNIDAVKVNILVDTTLYSKVLYKLDMEDYFKLDIDGPMERNTFEWIAKAFTTIDDVSAYENQKHPYDSRLGKEVEGFYKMNFPVNKEKEVVDAPFSYIDEDLEPQLVEEQGYPLFLQGLHYENPLMNYYSAYRLIEYYGSENKEEIMLELATCASKSKDKRVQMACRGLVELLSPLKEGEIRVFDRFVQTSLGGGKKLYTISDSGLGILAKWQGEMSAGLKIISLSPNRQYALCQASSENRNYRYVIPIVSDLDEPQAYRINEKGVYKQNVGNLVPITPEITGLLQERVGKLEEAIEWNWDYGGMLKISVNGQELIYFSKDNKLLSKEQFNQNFDMSYLQTYLEDCFGAFKVEKLSFDSEAKASTYFIKINQEKLLVCEYESMMQKNAMMRKQEEESKKIHGIKWSKGKTVVYYEGSNQEMIQNLNNLMG